MMQVSDVHAISSYGPTAASTRVRLDDWFRFLRLQPTFHRYAGLNNNRPRSIVAHASTVIQAEQCVRKLELAGQRIVLSREASPFSRGNVEERLLGRAAHGVYDFDDALFVDESPIRRLLRTHDKSRRATAAADVVIAGNDYLANWAEHHSKNVRIIPSCIDPREYEPKASWTIDGDAPMLVWLGSPSSEKFVSQIAPALLEIHRRTGATLTLISGPDYNASFGALNRMIHRVPWSLRTFASALAKADVAIAPLDDEPYSRGKCAYKMLQYAATGLPIVGSHVGANQLALQRFDGLEVQAEDDWVQALMGVVTETAARRAARGHAGRTGVEAYYSFSAWKSQWCDATGITETEGATSTA